MSDKALEVAYNPHAPQDERTDANAQAQRETIQAVASDINPSRMQPIVDFVAEQYEDQQFNKSFAKKNVIPFPSRAVENGVERGMQSVWLNDNNFSSYGDWYERPSAFSFQAMRQMVDQTPVLSSVIFTRIRQVQRFCRRQKGGKGPGFKIAPKTHDEHIDETEKRTIMLLEDFFINSGWESKPRQRMRLRRDDFPSMMSKLVRDSLTMDSMPIETEFKRDKRMGLDGIYAVDGATIRLCSEIGYRGDDEVFALQVVDGNIRSVYTYDDLIYVPRNPRTDVMVGGYGMSETELLIRVVTGFLNAFTYNTKFFDSNQIPKGLLHISGSYDDKDLNSFKRYWNSMVKGVNNAWSLPVMVSKDQESKASFEKFGVEINEIQFSKWMTFLTSIICAIYGIAPDEINFESFTSGASSLSGSDTEEKIANSKDKGLRPLLSYFEGVFSDFIVSEFSDKYAFEWTGLDEEDEKQVWERKKMTRTVNEIRAEDGVDKITDAWGDAPLNPSLVGAWQQAQQEGQEDYGNPEQGGSAPGMPGGGDEGQGEDFGDAGEDGEEGGADFGSTDTSQEGEDPGQAQEMQKSFGLPVYSIEP